MEIKNVKIIAQGEFEFEYNGQTLSTLDAYEGVDASGTYFQYTKFTHGFLKRFYRKDLFAALKEQTK